MLEIRNEAGKVLDLAPEQRVTVEIMSALFADDEVLKGSKSLPINVPLTENNQTFLEGKFHYHSDSFPDIACTVSFNALTLHRCALNYRIRNSSIEAYLKIDLGEIANQLKKLKLSDVITEQVSVGQSTEDRNATYKAWAEATPGTYPLVVFPVRNENFFEEGYAPTYAGHIYANMPYVNWYDVVEQRFISDSTLNFGTFVPGLTSLKLFGLPIVPFVYVRYTIEKVCEYFELKAVGAWLDEYETRRLVWDNNVAIFEDFVSTGFILFDSTLDVKDYVPSLTISDFFRALRSSFGLGIFVDTTLREVEFKPAKTMRYEESYVEVGFAQSDRLTVEEEISKGITVENAIEGDDIYKGYPPKESHIIGDGEKNVPLKIGTLPMKWEYNPTYSSSYQWVLPTTKVAGNTPGNLHRNSERFYNVFQSSPPPNRCPLRVLMYHGMKADSHGQLYPYASSVSIDYAGNKVANYSLWPNENDSIFEYFQRDYYEILESGRTVTAEHVMSIADVAKIKPQTKIAGRLDGLTLSRFFLKQLSYGLANRESDSVLVELQLIPLKPLSVAPSVINDPTEATIYAELRFLDESEEIVYDETLPADIWVYFWTTPAKTTAQSVTDLEVILREEGFDSQFGSNTTEQPFICNGIKTKIVDAAVRYSTYTDGGNDYFNAVSYYLIATSAYRVL